MSKLSNSGFRKVLSRVANHIALFVFSGLIFASSTAFAFAALSYSAPRQPFASFKFAHTFSLSELSPQAVASKVFALSYTLPSVAQNVASLSRPLVASIPTDLGSGVTLADTLPVLALSLPVIPAGIPQAIAHEIATISLPQISLNIPALAVRPIDEHAVVLSGTEDRSIGVAGTGLTLVGGITPEDVVPHVLTSTTFTLSALSSKFATFTPPHASLALLPVTSKQGMVLGVSTTNTALAQTKKTLPLIDKLSLALYCSFTKNNVDRTRCNYDAIADGSIPVSTASSVAATTPAAIPATPSNLFTSNDQGVASPTFITKYITQYVGVPGTPGRDGKDGVNGVTSTVNGILPPAGLGSYIIPSYSSPSTAIGISTIGYLKDTTIENPTITQGTAVNLSLTTPILNSPTLKDAVFTGLSLFTSPASFTSTVAINSLTATSSVITNASTTNAYIANLFVDAATSTNSYVSQLVAASSTLSDAVITNSTTTNAYIANLVAASSTLTDLIATNAAFTNSTTTNAFISSLALVNGSTTNSTTTNSYITNLFTHNATTTNAIITNSTTTNAYITSLAAASTTIDDLVTTRATSTALFANLLSAIDTFITNLTATNLTATNATVANATTTNSTTTNAYVANLSTDNATTTNAYVTNLTASSTTIGDLITTRATSTAFFSTLLSAIDTFITNLTAINLNATNATIANATTTNSTTTNAYIENLSVGTSSATSLTIGGDLSVGGTSTFATTSSTYAAIDTASTTNLSGTNFWSTLATIISATITNLIATNATTTNATSTNFYASNGVIDNATTTNLFTQTLSVGNGYIQGDQSVQGSFNVAGTSTLGSNVFLNGNVVIGTSSNELLTVNSLINSDVTPAQNKVYDLGTPSFYWRTLYADSINVNSISAASTTISGTSNNSFTINSDNNTNDLEDSQLVFYRGLVTPNAILRWNSALSRLEANQSFKIQNETPSVGTTTLTVQAGAGQGTTNLFELLDNSGSKLAMFNSQGWLGIGTSSPVAALDVNGPIKSGGDVKNVLNINDKGSGNLQSTLRILTNIPYADGLQALDAITITGYDWRNSKPLSLRLVFYIFGGNFIQYGASSQGGLAPRISLGNVNGKVAILLDRSSGGGGGDWAFSTLSVDVMNNNNLWTQSDLSGWSYDYGNLSGASNVVALSYSSQLGNASTTGLTATNIFSTTLAVTGTSTFGTNGSNVGIGTTSPQATLEVAGAAAGLTVNRTHVQCGASIGLVNNSNVSNSWSFKNSDSPCTPGTLGNLYFIQNSTEKMVLTSGGVLGIGSTTPSLKLTVQGAAYIGGNIVATGTLSLGTSTLFTTSAGNVGIGTSTPLAKFAIVDSNQTSTSSSGAVGMANANLSIFTNQFGQDFGGSVGFGGYQGSSGQQTLFGQISGRKENASDPNARGYLAFSTLGTGAGVAYPFAERVRISSDGSLVINSNGYDATSTKLLIVKGSASQAVNLQEWQNSFGTALSVVDASGNLGLGTSTPGSKLSVQGSAYIGGNFTATGTLTTLGTGSSSIAGALGVGIASPSYFLDVVPPSGTAVDLFRVASSTSPGGALVVKNNGSVGIGTTTPLNTLVVSGPALGGITIDRGNSNSPNLTFSSNGTTILSQIRGVIGGGMAFTSSSLTEWGHFDASGNFGIGTSSPASPLHVYSNSSNAYIITDTSGTNNTGVQFRRDNTIKWQLFSDSLDNFGIFDGTNKIATIQRGAPANSLFVLANGNVGVGTSTPGSKLSVQGDSYLAGNVTATGTLTVLTSGTSRIGSVSRYVTMFDNGSGQVELAFNGSDANASRISTDNNDLWIRPATGVIGIAAGTTSPRLKIGSISSGWGMQTTLAAPMNFESLSVDINTNPFVFNRVGAWGGNPNVKLFKVQDAGNDVFSVGGVLNAINGLTVGPSATSGMVSLTAVGLDTNIPFAINAKGSGSINIGGTSTGNIVLATGGGSVAIGTSSPSSQLEVSGGAASSYLTLSTNSGVQATGIKLVASGTTTNWIIGSQGGAVTNLQFVSGAGNSLTLDSTANMVFSNTNNHSISIAQNSATNIPGKQLTVSAGNAALGLATNFDGGTLVLAAGQSTGTGTGKIQFQTSPAGSSGTATNTLITAMTILGGGNVGIGTSTPGSLFSVQGNSYIGGNETATGTLTVLGTGNSSFAGNVGIGTTTPGNPLVITASGVTSSLFSIASSTGANLVQLASDGVTGSSLFNASTGENRFNINPNGQYVRVSGAGVYGWSPSTNAGVSADTGLSRISAGVVAVGNGTTGSAAGTLVAGAIGIGTTTPSAKLMIDGTIANTNSGQGLVISATNGTTVGPRLAIFPNGNASAAIQTLVNGALNFLSSAGNVNMTIADATGNVGIGTSTPGSRLSVQGDSYFGGNLTATGTITSLSAGNSYFAGNIGIGTSSPTHALTFASTSSGIAFYNTSDQTTNYERFVEAWNPSNNTFNLFQSFGGSAANRSVRLGIAGGAGATAPDSYLDVVSNGTFNFRSANPAATTYTTLGLGALQNASSYNQTTVAITPTINQSGTGSYTALLINPTETGVGSGNNYLINAQVGGSTRMVLTNTGNLGIGTTTPLSKFVIDSGSAVIRGTNNNLQVVDNGTGRSFVFGVAGTSGGFFNNATIGDSILRASTGNKMMLGIDNGTGNAAPVLTISGTNVGIGTTTPGRYLTIQAVAGSSAGFDLADPNTNQVWSFINGTTGSPVGAGNFAIYDTTNQATRMVVSNAGNVGVGTTTPGSLLSVQGNGYFGGNLTATGTLSVLGSATSTFAGAVGIGTTTPSYNLSVVGNTYTSGSINFGGAGNNNLGVLSQVGTNDTYLSNHLHTQFGLWVRSTDTNRVKGMDQSSGNSSNLGLYVNFGEKMTIDTNGNVGIGTTTPGSKLSVQGDAYIGGNVTATGTFAIGTSTLFTNTAGQVGIGTTNPSYRLDVRTTGAATGLAIWDGSNGSIFGRFGITRVGATANTFSFINYPSYAFDATTTISSGNFGIGTTTPGSKLAVQGDGYFGGNLTATGTITALGGFTNFGSTTLTDASSTNLTATNFWSTLANLVTANITNASTTNLSATGATFGDASITNTLTVASNTSLATTTISGYLGVGTTSPSQLLTVGNNNQFTVSSTGTVAISSAGQLSFTGGSIWPIITRNTATGGLILNTQNAVTSSNSLLSIRTNGGSDAFTLLADGRLGLGTSTPASKLTIISPDNSQGTSIVAAYANNLTQGTSLRYDGLYAIGSNSSVDVRLVPQGVGRVLIPNGNVGIGTSTPLSVLHIEGTNSSAGGITLTSSAGNVNRFQIFPLGSISTAFKNMGGGDTQFQNSAGTAQLSIQTSTGNVGIGTTTPGSLLSVQGDSYFGGNVTATGTLSVLGSATSTFAGAVGIGTTTPQWKLSVEDPTSAFITLNNSTGNAGTFAGVRFQIAGKDRYTAALNAGGDQIYSRFNASGAYQNDVLALKSTGDVAFNTNQLYVTNATGNVGIGTSTPGTNLVVGNSGAFTVNSSGQVTTGSTLTMAGSNNAITAYNGIGGSGIFGLSRQNDVANASLQIAAYGGIGFTVNSAGGSITPASTSSSMFIATSGNVGIGTTTPTKSLSVINSSLGGDQLLLGSTGTANPAFLQMGVADTGSNTTVDLSAINNASQNAYVRLFRQTNTIGSKVFQILKGDGTANADTQITVAGTTFFNLGGGNVGVGSSSPVGRLAVTGSGLSNGIAFQITDASNTPRFTLQDNGTTTFGQLATNTNAILLSSQNGTLSEVYDNSDMRWSLDSNGSVRYGLSAGGTSQLGTLRLGSGGSVSPSSYSYITGGGAGQAQLNFFVGSTSSPSITLTNSGKVGVGTTSPVDPFHVIGNGRFMTSGSSEYLTVGTYDSNNAYLRYATFNVSRFVTGVDASDGKYKIGTGNDFSATKFAIDTNGNVGIGTTSPISVLHIVASNATISLQSTTTNGFSGQNMYDSNGNLAASFQYGNSAASVFPNAMFLGTRIANAPVIFISGGSASGGSTNERMRIDSNGNVGIGTSTPSYPLDVSGFINTDKNSGYKMDGLTVLYSTSTQQSVFVGQGAGAGIVSSAATTSVLRNTAMGYLALNLATSTGSNTAFGARTLSNVQSGAQSFNGTANTAVGAGSGFSVTTGFGNSSFGESSGGAVTTGAANTSLGYRAGNNITTGSNNVAVGGFTTAVGALFSNQTGSNNVAVGAAALAGTTSVSISSNTAVGHLAGFNMQGNNNTLLGYQAGYDMSTGSQNIVVGYYPTTNVGITTGSNNILIGQDLRTGLSQTGSNQLNIGNLIFATGLGSGSTLSTGNVGIGTSTPGQKLDVVGNIRLTGTGSNSIEFYDSTNAANGPQVLSSITGINTVNHGSGALQFFTAMNNTLTEAMRIDRTGNIGMGTTSPGSKLSVQGDGYFGGNLTATGTLNVLGTGSSTFASDLTVNGDNGRIYGNYLFTDPGSAGSTTLRLGTQGVARLLLSSADATFTGNIIPNGDNTKTLGTLAARFNGLNIGTGNSTFAGNVGIGTTTPNQKLVISGTSLSATQPEISLYNTGSGGIGWSLISTDNNNSALGGKFAILPTGGSSVVAPFIISGNNVGIGTSTPGSKLSVNGDSYLAGNVTATGTLNVLGTGTSTFVGALGVGVANPNAVFHVSSPTSTSNVVARIDNTSGSYGWLFQNAGGTTSRIALYGMDNTGAQTLRLDPAAASYFNGGNVGIGTTTPGSLLSVQGNGYFGGNVAATGTLAIGTSTLYTTAQGNVGIGTTTPLSTLYVEGSSPVLTVSSTGGRQITIAPATGAIDSVNSALHFNRFSSQAVSIGFSSASHLRVGQAPENSFGNTALLYIGNTETGTPGFVLDKAPGQTSDILQVRSATTTTGDIFTIKSNGNVGIGTTTPSQLLTVGNNNQFTVTSAGAVNIPSGNLYALTMTTGAIANNNSNTYANLVFGNAGLTASRNVADSNPSLIVNQANASSTGDILDLQAAGITKVAFAQNGNVGIGTTSPLYALEVASSSAFGVPSATQAPILIRGGASGTAMLTFTRTVGATAQYSWALAGGGLSFSDDLNGGVTTNVFGDNNINQLYIGQRSRITDTSGKPSLLAGQSYSNLAGSDINAGLFTIRGGLGNGAGTPGDITFETGNVLATGSTPQSATRRMTILANSGNVGIGTTTPGSLLSVQGNGYFGGNFTATGTITSLGTATSSFVGALGVGTSTQSYKFAVMGTNGIGVDTESAGGSAVGLVSINNATIRLNTANFVQLEGTQGTRFTNNGASVEYGRITSAGLGIGTTTPGSKLSVQGDSYLAGNVTATGTLNMLGTSSSTIAGALSIGTTSAPAALLDVGGNTRIGLNTISFLGTATISSQGQININSGSTRDIQLNTNTGNFSVLGNGNSNNFTVLGSNGNVGIGTSSPSYKLEVNGAANIRVATDQNMRFGSNSNGAFLATYLDTQASFNTIQLYGSTILLNPNAGGNVGIGTTTPLGSKLAVQGDGYFGGNLTATGTLTVLSSALFGGNVLPNVTNTYDLGSASARWNNLFVNNFTASSSVADYFTAASTTATSTFNGNVVIGSGSFAYDASSTQTTISNLAIGNLAFDQDAGQVSWVDLPISGATATGTIMSYTSQLGGNNMLTVYGEHDGQGGIQNPRFGFGTTTPTSYFHIAATGTNPFFTVGTSTNQGLFTILSNGYVGLGTSTPSSNLYIQGSDVTPNLTVASSSGATQFTVLANGNVGIGTSTPGSKFSVTGDSYFGGNVYATGTLTSVGAITSSTATASSSIAGGLKIASGGLGSLQNGLTVGNTTGLNHTVDIGATGMATLRLSDSGGRSITFGSNRNSYDAISGTAAFVGVQDGGSLLLRATQGTSNHVILQPGATGTVYAIGQSFAVVPNPSATYSALFNVGTGSSTQQLVAVATTTNAGIFNILANGAVGIGTTTPTTPLTVVGNSSFFPSTNGVVTIASASWNANAPLKMGQIGSSGAIQFARASDGNGVASIGYASGTNSTDFRIGSNGGFGTINFDVAGVNSVMTLDSNSRVGIGTTSPGSLFSVQGNGYFGGNITATGTITSLATGTSTLNGNLSLAYQTGIFTTSNGTSTLLQVTRSDGTQPGLFRTNGWRDFTVSGAFGVGYDLATTTGSAGAGNLLVSGNIGIGTTSPAAALHLTGSSNMALRIQSSGVNGYAELKNASVNGSPSQLNVSSDNNDDTQPAFTINAFRTTGGVVGNLNAAKSLLSVAASGTSVFDIKQSGNVGIGTSTPQSALEITGANKKLTFSLATTTTTFSQIYNDGNNLNIWSQSNSGSLINFQVNAQTLSLAPNLFGASNYWGFDGQTVTGRDFGIRSGAGMIFTTNTRNFASPALYLASSSAIALIGVGTSSPSATLFVQGSASSTLNPFAVASSSGTNLFTINPSGNVAIGMTPVSAGLVINGIDNGAGGSPTGAGGLRVYRPNSGSQYISLDYSDGSQGYLTANGDKGFNLVNYGSSTGNNIRIVNNYANASVSNGIFVSTSNNVGIGTTTPGSLFSVQGNAYVGGNVTATGTLTTLGTATSSVMGSLVIGTSTMTSVAGQLDVFASAAGVGSYIRGNNPSNSNNLVLGIANGFNIAPTAMTGFYNDSGNNVGLRFLDTNGAVSRAKIGTNSDTYFAVGLGNVGIGTSTPGSKFSVTGDSYFGGNITATGTLNVFNNIRISGSGNGLYFPDGTFMGTAAGTSTGITSPTDLALAADNDTDGSGVLTFSTFGLERMRVLNNGSIGIGTTSPAGLLGVNGDGYFGGNLTATGTLFSSNIDTDANNATLRLKTQGITRLTIDNSNTQFNNNAIPNVDNTRSLGSLSARWNSLNIGTGTSTFAGAVGIGTTTPAEALEVANGNIQIGFNQFLKGRSASGASFNLIGVNSSGNTTVGNLNHLIFIASGAERARIDGPTGNFGIGTTSPGSLLSVQGNGYFGGNLTATGTITGASTITASGQITSGNIGFQTIGNGNGTWFGRQLTITGGTYIVSAANGTTFNSATTSFNGAVAIGTSSLATTPSFLTIFGSSTLQSTNLFTLASSTGASLFTVTSAGNVGIGTTTPGSLLSVQGDGYFGGNLTATGTITSLSAGNNYFAGNVGIGTTTPARVLEVFGTFNVGTSSLSQIFADTSSRQVGINATSSSLISNSSLTIGATSSLSTGISITGITQGTGFSAASITSGTALTASNLSTGTGFNLPALTSGTGINIGSSNNISTAKGLTFSTASGGMTTASAINITGSAAMNADYSGALINLDSVRSVSVASTRFHSGNMMKIAPQYGVNGSGSATLLVSGTTTMITRTLSNASTGATSSLQITAPLFSLANLWSGNTGTTTDSSALFDLYQGFATSTGTLLRANSLGSGALATFVGSGNFGIGTSTPTAKLDVYGTGSAQPFRVSSSTSASLFEVESNGNVGIGTTTPGSLLSVNGDGYFGGNLTATGTLSILNNSSFTGAVNASSTFAVTGNATFYGAINVSGLATFANASTTNLSVAAASYFGGNTSVMDQNGNLGLGTTTPGLALDIWTATTSTIDMLRIGSGNGIAFRVDSAGNIFSNGATTIGAPADVAESYPALEAVDAGTVVAFGTSTVAWSSTRGSATSTASSSDVYQISGIKKARDQFEAIGIVSTRPGLHIGADVQNGVPVALAGRVPVKVTDENGAVKAGDFLTVSLTRPGYAMKLTGEGKSIGRAISDYVPGNDKVIAYVENGYQKVDMNGKSATTTNMLTTGNVDLNANGVAIYNIKSLASASGAWSISEDGRIIAKVICLEDVCINKDQLTKILNSTGQTGMVAGTSTTSSPVDTVNTIGNGTSTDAVSTVDTGNTETTASTSPTASTGSTGSTASTETTGPTGSAETTAPSAPVSVAPSDTQTP